MSLRGWLQEIGEAFGESPVPPFPDRSKPSPSDFPGIAESAPRPSKAVRWYLNGRPTDAGWSDLGPLERGQQVGRIAVENTGTEPISRLRITAPRGLELAADYTDTWREVLYWLPEVLPGRSVSFVARASVQGGIGLGSGRMVAEELPESEWCGYEDWEGYG